MSPFTASLFIMIVVFCMSENSQSMSIAPGEIKTSEVKVKTKTLESTQSAPSDQMSLVQLEKSVKRGSLVDKESLDQAMKIHQQNLENLISGSVEETIRKYKLESDKIRSFCKSLE